MGNGTASFGLQFSSGGKKETEVGEKRKRSTLHFLRSQGVSAKFMEIIKEKLREVVMKPVLWHFPRVLEQHSPYLNWC